MFTAVEDFKTVLDKTGHGIRAKYNEKGSIYLSKELSFGVLSPKYEEKTNNLEGLVQKLPGFHCRGFLNEALYGSLKGCGMQWGFNNHIQALNIEDHPVLFVLGTQMSDEHLEKTLLLLNSLEDKAGWERSVSYKIEPVKEGEAKTVLIGPNNWLRGTPYLSLYCLILRCTTRTKYNPQKSPAEFFKEYKNAKYQTHDYRTVTATKDSEYWRTIFEEDDDMLDTLVINQDRILGKDPLVYIKDRICGRPQSYLHGSGINLLITKARQLRDCKKKEGEFKKDKTVRDYLDYYARENYSFSFIKRFFLNFAEVLHEQKQEKSRVL